MRLLVTSAAGANGDGYGALLAFDRDGRPQGVFSDDARIADPRGLATENGAGLLFVNSGADRVVALDARAKIVRDTGPVGGLNPGGGVFGPDHRYYVGLRGARTIMALRSALDAAGELVLAPGVVPFPRGFACGRDSGLFLASGIGPDGEGDDTIVAVAPGGGCYPTRGLIPELRRD